MLLFRKNGTVVVLLIVSVKLEITALLYGVIFSIFYYEYKAGTQLSEGKRQSSFKLFKKKKSFTLDTATLWSEKKRLIP